MLADTREGRLLLNEAAYAIVRQEAPDELPVYVSLRNRYLADPEGFAGGAQPQDEALGFGNAADLQAFTQVVFPLLAPMLLHIVTQAALALQDEGGKQAAEWVRGLFRDPDHATAPQTAPQPLFSQAQLDVIKHEVEQIAEREGRLRGFSKRKIARVNDALIARLALVTA
jgi:hypothetical protein